MELYTWPLPAGRGEKGKGGAPCGGPALAGANTYGIHTPPPSALGRCSDYAGFDVGLGYERSR